ncbi:MAG TPA: alpha/beta fold hydrolase [Flavobacterium sp.]|jgi:pimeloyl-ACP methyl ester carboxylesterase|uniref:alpha/beta fold hydrolase n=1 Tax=Flavobacterium sp. TaxID=239 RepID=UPI002B69A561|nr:alpha/beta fold hydrolase [Flavobacterium sp.]HPW97960.1 alpha/beta fold hydrolase [Flavobacterium sp.]HQA74108.1 alpha/beta fold hydrolase [Flavobacterium sp.]
MLYSKIEGEGKPLIILHGFLGMLDNWKSIGSKYVENGFQVHLLDMRNHGRSFHSEEFNYRVMANDIFEYCQNHNLVKIDLIGHSMGGKIAMLFASTYPKLVDKLIIADIGPKYYKPHHQDILAGLNAVDFSTKPDRSEVEEVLAHYIPDFGTRQFLMKSLFWREQGQLAFRFNLEVFNDKIEEVGKELPIEKHFENPTLFIRGGNSRYILDSDLPDIKRQFPNFELKTIPNVGHWLHAENPELFLKITLDFLV